MRLNASGARRAAMGCGVLVAAVVAASCGGGEPVTTFHATRILAFGDETSLIVDSDGNGNGHKYSINGVVSGALACGSNPIWIQTVANNFGQLVFPQCNPAPNAVSTPPNRIRATFGATAADLSAQIDAQLADSAFQPGDLATVLVGVNDVLGPYAQYPTVSEPVLTANLQAAGAEVGRQVNRLADLGAKVIISTIPDVGYSPYAVAERAAHADTDRQAMIIRLAATFNSSMRSTIVNDGRRIGLVLMDEFVEAIGKFNGLNGFTNSTTGACDLSRSALVPPSILDCTDLTLIAGASPTTFLWADDRHLSYGGQLQLGNLAAQRAKNNPF
ncbi:MAG: SGNH/GDSL hydrolase family protein [Caldimonas sp.]